MLEQKLFVGMCLMGPEIEVEISDTQGHLRVDSAALDQLVRFVLAEEGRRAGSVSIALVDNATIHAINRAHLAHDWPTDVITFPLGSPDDSVFAGELVISAEMACTAASEFGVDASEELALYVVHGLLHLCGFDDRDDAERAANAPARRRNAVALRALQRMGGPAMDGMSFTWMLALGLAILVPHLVSIALTKALQSYSRSLLAGRCESSGHADRVHEVERWAQKTERAAESLAVLTGLLLASLMGVWAQMTSLPSGAGFVVFPVLVIGLLGYVIAGVVGKVFAEVVIDTLWPLSPLLRAVAAPLTFGLRQVEHLVGSFAADPRSVHRPAHLQVEVPGEDEATAQDDEPELSQSARALVQQAILLTRTDVGTLMKPRSSIVSLPSTVSAAEAAKTFRRTGLSRVPIFEESRDDIVGILYAKDLFGRMTEARPLHAITPRDLVRPALFVPESKNAYDLLEEMRLERRHFAIVLDEYGGVAGLVSLEDLLEELVGPIDDEHDFLPSADPVRKLGGSLYDVDAAMTLEEVNERFNLQLPTDAEFQTIGGLVFHELGRLPAQGDSVNAFAVAFSVVEVSDHTIRRLMIDLAPAGATASHQPSGSST